MARKGKKNPDACKFAKLLKFSEIEDAELNKYLLSANERRLKTALWELINRDYLEVGNAASAQTKASEDKSQDTRKYDKDKKRKRGQNDGRSIQGQALPNKAVELDAKRKEVKSSVANDPDVINVARENRLEKEIEEFTFNDDDE